MNEPVIIVYTSHLFSPKNSGSIQKPAKIHFNIILIHGLLLLISNLINLRVSESERYAYWLWPLAAAYLIISSVFRGICKIS